MLNRLVKGAMKNPFVKLKDGLNILKPITMIHDVTIRRQTVAFWKEARNSINGNY